MWKKLIHDKLELNKLMQVRGKNPAENYKTTTAKGKMTYAKRVKEKCHACLIKGKHRTEDRKHEECDDLQRN